MGNKKVLKNKGFTLIELLIVIAIVVVIASLVIMALKNARGGSRDAKRVANLDAILGAIEIYKDAQGVYPSTTGSAGSNCWVKSDDTIGGTCNISGATVQRWKGINSLESALSGYLSVLPNEPSKNFVYWYRATETSYKLMAKLEENPEVMVNDGGVETGFYEVYNLDGQALPVNPPVSATHLVISEVYYDVDAAHCGDWSGCHLLNNETQWEWLEIYNPTQNQVDLKDWTIKTKEYYSNNQWLSCETKISSSSKILEPDNFAILIPQNLVLDKWSYYILPILKQDFLKIVTGGFSCGYNAWDNTNDRVILNEPLGTPIDQMGWGTEASIFPNGGQLSASPQEGYSFQRTETKAALSNDTDSASDFRINENPMPGPYSSEWCDVVEGQPLC